VRIEALHLDTCWSFSFKVFFFWHIVVFYQCGFASLGSDLKIGHARRLGLFTRQITLNDEYLSQFLPDRKVLWMTLEQLCEIFVKLLMFYCSRATCVSLRGQNKLLVPSEWGNARNPSKNNRDPFHGHIESIKSAGRRSWKVTFKTCPGFFLEIFFLVQCWFPNMPFDR